MVLKIGDKAPDLVLTTADNQQVELNQLWQEKSLVLDFLRHFG